MPAWIFLLQYSTWLLSWWGSLYMVANGLTNFRNMRYLLEATDRGCPLRFNLISHLKVIQGVRSTVNAKLRLEAIAANSRSDRIVSILLHSNSLSTDVRSYFLQNAIRGFVRCWTWLLWVLHVNIRIKPSRLTANDDARPLNMLRVFLGMEGCSILFSSVPPFMVFSVVSVWRRD